MEMCFHPAFSGQPAFIVKTVDERSLGIKLAHDVKLAHQVIGLDQMHVEPLQAPLQGAEGKHAALRFPLGQSQSAHLGEKSRAETDLRETLTNIVCRLLLEKKKTRKRQHHQQIARRAKMQQRKNR